MTESLSARLQEARRAKGLTQQQIANALGVSRAAVGQWEKGVTEPSVRNMKALNDLLSLSIDRSGIASSDLEPMGWRMVTSQPANSEFNIDVPIRMLSMSSSAICRDISYSSTNLIDNVYRPPSLLNRGDIYAVLVLTSSLYPRFENEDVIYVSGDEKPLQGEYAIISIQAINHGKDDTYLRRIKSLSSTSITLELFSPASEVTLPLSRILHMHRVLPWNELLQFRPEPWRLHPEGEDQ